MELGSTLLTSLSICRDTNLIWPSTPTPPLSTSSPTLFGLALWMGIINLNSCDRWVRPAITVLPRSNICEARPSEATEGVYAPCLSPRLFQLYCCTSWTYYVPGLTPPPQSGHPPYMCRPVFFHHFLSSPFGPLRHLPVLACLPCVESFFFFPSSLLLMQVLPLRPATNPRLSVGLRGRAPSEGWEVDMLGGRCCGILRRKTKQIWPDRKHRVQCKHCCAPPEAKKEICAEVLHGMKAWADLAKPPQKERLLELSSVLQAELEPKLCDCDRDPALFFHGLGRLRKLPQKERQLLLSSVLQEELEPELHDCDRDPTLSFHNFGSSF